MRALALLGRAPGLRENAPVAVHKCEAVECHAERLARLETFRTPDGGYDVKPGAPHGNAYGCFVALGAYQDLRREIPEPLRMVQCLKFLETPDGAW